MKRALTMLAGLALALSATVGLAATSGPAAAAAAPRTGQPAGIPSGLHPVYACAHVAAGQAHCMSFYMAYPNGRAFTSPLPSGYGPPDFQDAYKLPSSTDGKGVTVALVDAYDDPNAEADLQVYRAQYGLPVCDTSNGCFKKVDMNGGTNYPQPNAGWAVEVSLDLDMVSAICPNCNILLVEARNGAIKFLGRGVNTAVKMGAHAVSNSYENRIKVLHNQSEDNKYYNHPGVAITVASGDSGYNYRLQYPGSSPYTVAVGGTVLTKDSGNKRGWDETAWSGAGSECSSFEPKPSWQTDTGCSMRTVADVSAAALNAAVYDTYQQGGWLVVGGTSESSPIVAGVFGLANDNVKYGSRVYKNPSQLFDITSGSNGSCSPSYLCNAGPGYDGPTGLGSPDGIGDF
jgi:subtilase family serine protease